MNEQQHLLVSLEEQLSQDILAIAERYDKKRQLDERAAELVDEILEALAGCFARYAAVK